LLAAFLGLLAVGALLHYITPVVLSRDWQNAPNGFLYTIWGMALGKRSRDLGTTFTYGMVVGMLFPVIGVVFLFQKGKKEKEEELARVALAAAQSHTVEP